jgi:hypothetical protein
LPETNQGEVSQEVNATFDITEHKRVQEALLRAHEELERRVVERTNQLTSIHEQLLSEINERKRAEEKLLRSEAYLAEAQRLSHTGVGHGMFSREKCSGQRRLSHLCLRSRPRETVF